MENRAIVFTKPGTAELVAEPMPVPKPGEVLVRLVRSTISSGTERANVTGVPDNARAFLNLLAIGRISLNGFVDEVYSPSECAKVYSRLAEGGAFPTVQFNWEKL